jgi:hypothetical protein
MSATRVEMATLDFCKCSMSGSSFQFIKTRAGKADIHVCILHACEQYVEFLQSTLVVPILSKLQPCLSLYNERRLMPTIGYRLTI